MVVVVYTDKEVKNGKKSINCDTKCDCEVIEVNNCIESDSKDEQSVKVNINNASVEELMSLSGIGESKANAIVTYRENNGNFKGIEEIKNVSGIGDSLFENIKDDITI
jgi:competence protein ComEA